MRAWELFSTSLIERRLSCRQLRGRACCCGRVLAAEERALGRFGAGCEALHRRPHAEHAGVATAKSSTVSWRFCGTGGEMCTRSAMATMCPQRSLKASSPPAGEGNTAFCTLVLQQQNSGLDIRFSAVSLASGYHVLVRKAHTRSCNLPDAFTALSPILLHPRASPRFSRSRLHSSTSIPQVSPSRLHLAL